MDESSGLAQSSIGVWFTHEDSGSDSEIHAFDLNGRDLGVSRVAGAKAKDWEDMASGPCPGGEGRCLYIADIGDNEEERAHVTVYAVAEPTPGQDTEVVASYEVSYPDRPRNAEAILVHPFTGRIWIVTKADSGKSIVYRLPENPGEGEMEKVATLHFDGKPSERRVTGAAWSPDGRRIVVRTYSEAHEWRVDPNDPEAHWSVEPVSFEIRGETQGEAIAYATDGSLVTTSEGDRMEVSIMRKTTE